MASIFIVRHQRAGIVASHAFSNSPTQAQLAPIRAELERVHGPGRRIELIEIPLLGPNDIPVVPIGPQPTFVSRDLATPKNPIRNT